MIPSKTEPNYGRNMKNWMWREDITNHYLDVVVISSDIANLIRMDTRYPLAIQLKTMEKITPMKVDEISRLKKWYEIQQDLFDLV
jgi:hypothetical protein